MKNKTADIRDRRLFSRKAFRTDVIFEDEFGDGLFYVKSLDVSMGGIFLASSIPVRVGTLLFLSMALPPHKRPVRFTGEVVRLTKPGSQAEPARHASLAELGSRGEAGGQGMGIRFMGLSDFARERLEEFLSDKSADK